MAALKLISSSTIEANTTELNALADKIWKNPELNHEEYKAHNLLTNFLEKNGFSVQRSYTGLETAFKASFGSGRPNICIICEYDALAEIGHACGHNLIAMASVAAGLGLKAAMESSSEKLEGTVVILGTPGEEGGGGKILLMKNGAFDDMDLAMMVHPTPASIIRPSFNAVKEIQVTFRGKMAHAAAYPWEGINALDAAVLAYNSIAVLRQQMKPSWRVQVIILKGGVKPNIIPDVTVLSCYIKAPNVTELQNLESKVTGCFRSACVSTNCKVEIKQLNYVCQNIQHNVILAEKFAENYRNLGAEFVDEMEMYGSTDMVRISGIVPTIYPCYAIGSGEVNHSKEFAQVSNTPEAHASSLVAGNAMAHTCIDVLTMKGLLKEIRLCFERIPES